jgi:hypothetical protein
MMSAWRLAALLWLAWGATGAVWAQLPAAAAAAFADGRALLAQSQTTATASRNAILAASRVRQQLGALRPGRDAAADTAARQGLLQQLERQQAEGARLRAESEALRQRAAARLTDGLVAGWARWVGDTRPLTMDDEVRQFFAHNTVLRSVHPDQPMPAPPVPDADAARVHEMTLRLPMLAAQRAPPDLDIAAFQLSRDQRYFAHIAVHAEGEGPAASAAAVPLNRLHRWRLLVSDLEGQPVANAVIGVAGHMPGHVHGLPTQPRVTGELAPGVYLVEGLKFQMDGWWVMQFEIQPRDAVAAPDNVAFNLVF